MKIIHRLFQYLESKAIPHTRYEKEIGLSNGYLNTQLKRSADIGEGVLLKIIENSLDINPIWLLTGTGEMLWAPDGDAAVPAHRAPPPPGCPLCAEKEKLIAAQQRTIDILERELHHAKALHDDEREKGRHHTGGQKRKAG